MRERTLILLVGAVQFVNILDFMIVMPLGPDFAAALGIATSRLGYLGGAYTASAALAGAVTATFLDRFDRRPALGLAMLGLAAGTLAAAAAHGFAGLLAARVLAGAFGGPATALSLSIIGDTVPLPRRGRAMGAVMGAFSVSSIVGVPLALELARLGGWRLPFLAVGAMCAVVTGLVYLRLPPLRAHLGAERSAVALGAALPVLLGDRRVLACYGMAAVAMASGFILIPNISAYLQFNLGYPRDRLWLLYMAGGVASIFAMRAGGRMEDRYGSFLTGTIGSLITVGTMFAGFFEPVPWLPLTLIFVLFMSGNSVRNVSLNTIATRVTEAELRASFMSMHNAVKHLASAAGAFASSLLLGERPGGALVGMPVVTGAAVALSLLLPPLLWWTERQLAAGPVGASAAGQRRSLAAPPGGADA